MAAATVIALVGLAPMLAGLAVGAWRGPQRLAWAAVLLGMVCTGLAQSAGVFGVRGGRPVPALNAGDVLWFARILLVYGGLAAIIRTRVPRLDARAFAGGAIGALGACAVVNETAVRWLVAGSTGDAFTTQLRGHSPLVEAAAAGFLLGTAIFTGWPWRLWAPLLASIVGMLIGHIVDMHPALAGTGDGHSVALGVLYVPAGWVTAYAIYVYLCQGVPEATEDLGPSPVAAVFALMPLGVLIAGTRTHISTEGLVFAATAALVLVVRYALVVSANQRLLEATTREAATDALTGLGNRRAFLRALESRAEVATDDAPVTIALFDLNGFKRYNDTFGHPAGDSLLARLGAALNRAVEGRGSAWRLGGDEFCVILHTGEHDDAIAACARALTTGGEGFRIDAARGVVDLPRDAADPDAALRLADQRMYENKGTQRRSSDQSHATAALLQLVREQDPDLGEHFLSVAEMAADVARRLGADERTVEQTLLGGELHDIGKTAIPRAILAKPGPLTDEEWVFMRRHTTIGERILLADPALAFVAPVARSHHERWEGGGYPDGIAGEEIPLAARIVSVCDAYEAMIADRAYRRGRPPAEAHAELRRCSGSQFDPAVVAAFEALVADSAVSGGPTREPTDAWNPRPIETWHSSPAPPAGSG